MIELNLHDSETSVTNGAVLRCCEGLGVFWRLGWDLCGEFNCLHLEVKCCDSVSR